MKMKCLYFTGNGEKLSPDGYEWSDIELSSKKRQRSKKPFSARDQGCKIIYGYSCDLVVSWWAGRCCNVVSFYRQCSRHWCRSLRSCRPAAEYRGSINAFRDVLAATLPVDAGAACYETVGKHVLLSMCCNRKSEIREKHSTYGTICIRFIDVSPNEWKCVVSRYIPFNTYMYM
jgi:hypothetical protein